MGAENTLQTTHHEALAANRVNNARQQAQSSHYYRSAVSTSPDTGIAGCVSSGIVPCAAGITIGVIVAACSTL